MTNAADQGRARSALTYLAQVLRPDWDPPGIVAAVEALHRDRQPLGLIARATISAALTPSTKTPGGIAARIRDGFDGAETPAATPTAPHVSSIRCDHCGGIKPEGDEEHARICARLSGPTDSYREARAAHRGAAVRTDLARAAELVIGQQFAATTFVQRKLHVTFGTAAWLLDELEAQGVVGPRDGSMARAVLVPPERMADVLAALVRPATTNESEEM